MGLMQLEFFMNSASHKKGKKLKYFLMLLFGKLRSFFICGKSYKIHIEF